VARGLLLSRKVGWPKLQAYGWALADQATNVLGQWLLFGVLAVGVSFGSWGQGIGPPLLLAGLLVTASVATFGWSRERLRRVLPGLARGRRVERWLPDRLRPRAAGGGDADPWSALLGPLLGRGGARGSYWQDLSLGAAGFAAICLSNVLVLRALEAEAPVAQVAIAVLIGYLAGTVIGVWGGVGVTEAALTGLFLRLGIPLEAAATSALVQRALFYALVIGAGGGALWWLSRSERRESPQRADASALVRVVGRSAGAGDHVERTGVRSAGTAVAQRRTD
jgi:uncharacterized membrane protein YbhN (UPF0104 family)